MAEGLMKRRNKWVEEGKLVMGMVVVQVIATGLQLLSRVILTQGTFVFAFLFYRNLVGALCVLPFAIFFERGEGMRLIGKWPIFFWLFAVALTGISMAMGLFYYGLRDTTATYATNFFNLIPIVTFIFSILLRYEILEMHTRYGKVKVMGAILCLMGALVTIFYKGKFIHIDMDHISHHRHSLSKHDSGQPHWNRGTIFLVCSCLSYGLWFISQAKLCATYPYKLWATFYTSLIASAQQVLIGLCIDRSKYAWQLKWDLQLLTIFYSGALATAATFWLLSWAVAKRGPTYPSMFNPLTLIFMVTLETLILGVPISIGSLLGMFFILIGVYGFLLGKLNEAKANATRKVDELAATGVQTRSIVAVPMHSPLSTSSDNRVGKEIEIKTSVDV